MSIARVRIAPLERWCSESRELAEREGALEVGIEVEIETHSMRSSFCPSCNGREWKMTRASQETLLALYGMEEDDGDHGQWICEHLLEID